MKLAIAIIAATAILVSGAGRAEPVDVQVEDLLGAVTVYFGEDTGKGRALLVANNEGDADLRLYWEGKGRGFDKTVMKLAMTKKAIAFNGPMGGQQASLAVSERGSLVVKSENYAVGRTKWEKAITIVYKGGEFLVVGFTYKGMDGGDPKATGVCDLNLATGKGVRKGKPVTFRAAPVRLADWSDETEPKECRF